MKKCPYCAEKIQNEAVVCRYCGRDLPLDESGTAKNASQAREFVQIPIKTSNLKWILAALAAILVVWMGAKLLNRAKPMAPALEPLQQTNDQVAADPAPYFRVDSISTPLPGPLAVIAPENAASVRLLSRWGKGNCSDIAYSPDGRNLAVACSTGVYLYAADTLEELRYFETDSWASSLVFSPDGETLLSGSAFSIQQWSLDDGTLLRIMELPGDQNMSVNALAVSPDGHILASALWDGTIRLWQAGDGSLLRTLEGHTDAVESVAFSPDGQTLVSGSWDNTARVWRTSDGSLLRTLEGHTNYVLSLAFSPDGKILASGSVDGPIRLWQMDDGSLLSTLGENLGQVNGLAFSPDGRTLAAAASSWGRIWRVSDGVLLHTLELNTKTYFDFYAVAFSPDGQTLASITSDNNIRIWQTSSGSLLRGLEQPAAYRSSLVFSPDGQTLAFVTINNTVCLLRVSSGEAGCFPEEQHTGGVLAVAFSPDGQTLASGDWKVIRLWRVSDGSLLRSLEGHTDGVYGLAFSPDGQTLASGSYDNTVRLWNANDGSLLHTLNGHVRAVDVVAFSPDGQTLASGSWDATVRLWQVSDGLLLRVFEGHQAAVKSMAFSPDGQTLASKDRHATILWRVDDGLVLHSLPGEAVNGSVAFSPDGRLLAADAWDDKHVIRLWDAGAAGILQGLYGHAGGVDGLVFSPDGVLLASGSGDGTIRLWGIPGTGASSALGSGPAVAPAEPVTAFPMLTPVVPPVTVSPITSPPDPSITPASITLQPPRPGPAVIQKGEILNPTTQGDLSLGEQHVYTFTADSSSAYNYVWFALESLSQTLDPYLIIKVNGGILGEDDDSLSGIAGDYPGTARVPSQGNTYFCVDKKAQPVVFEVLVKDASGLGYGSYQLSSGFEQSRQSSAPCVQILPGSR